MPLACLYVQASLCWKSPTYSLMNKIWAMDLAIFCDILSALEHYSRPFYLVYVNWWGLLLLATLWLPTTPT